MKKRNSVFDLAQIFLSEWLKMTNLTLTLMFCCWSVTQGHFNLDNAKIKHLADTCVCVCVCVCVFLWIVGTLDFYYFYTDQTIFSISWPNPNLKSTPYRKHVCIIKLTDKHHLLFLIMFFSLGGTAGFSGFTILVGTFGPHNVA